MTINPQTYAVIGTSEGALALAAELRLAGHRIILSDREACRDTIQQLFAAPGIEVDCRIETFVGGKQQVLVTGIEVTGDLALGASKADVIILMTPQTAYEELLGAFAGALRDDQIILLCPGGLGGSMLVSRLAADAGAKGILVGQTASMPIGGRSTGPYALRIVSKKGTLPLGVYPARRTQELLDRLKADFPQLSPTVNALECGLASAAPGLHPIPMIMNAARIEADGPYIYDGYEITPTVARVIEAVDAEWQSIQRAVGAKVRTFSDLLEESYGVTGQNFYEVVHSVPAYRQVKSPPDLRYRYLSEDVPTQLVPAVALGRSLGVNTPLLEATVAFANAMHGCDYSKSGWSLEKLGLSGLDVDTIGTVLLNGHT
ncbi:NAD/NADP octopine/nopaline dehydrogenase family protein [Agrobacterium tumefaciens]|uniref:NAD/NADP octopine/nopaline dehydrogenase family protein n=1 Tax=Agrobacterium tumefaciens TaxID=358 RepID=UPI0022437454|nr:NAD/NADP-dependent octopine/nopaline dehydrogenase family protein [Agrobacterium tumefaciens]MCW8143067.1 NAD/NADP octopine/nopaline dehydrogenase family protein [Agrobacterium tumefaciens]